MALLQSIHIPEISPLFMSASVTGQHRRVMLAVLRSIPTWLLLLLSPPPLFRVEFNADAAGQASVANATTRAAQRCCRRFVPYEHQTVRTMTHRAGVTETGIGAGEAELEMR